MKVKNTLVICQSTNESLGQSICHLGHLERHDSAPPGHYQKKEITMLSMPKRFHLYANFAYCPSGLGENWSISIGILFYSYGGLFPEI